MSVITIAKFDDQEFEVEIFHDGSLEFLDYDINFDVAAREFGYPKTRALHIRQLWDRSAPDTIVECIPLSLEHLVLLAADWAEHVVHLYSNDGRNNERLGTLYNERNQLEIIRALRCARLYARSGFTDGSLKKEVFEYERQIDAMYREVYQEQPRQVARAAWNVLNASQAAEAIGTWDNIKMVSDTATRAASIKYEEIVEKHVDVRITTIDAVDFDRELSWQVRRFVDCMEAIGQGKDWPDMKATP